MTAQKFHIGKNGPGPCSAEQRECRFGDERHGTESEMIRVWEAEQESIFGENLLAGASKDPLAVAAIETLSKRANYSPFSSYVRYSDMDKDIAVNLALSSLTELSYAPISGRDNSWMTDGCSTVERYILEDGSAGYFKSFGENSHDEGIFADSGTSSLGAAINEVNAYRVSQILGPGFDELVPETVIREVDGYFGTLQREVKEVKVTDEDYRRRGSKLKADYRRAAIFDFAIGNLDRHSSNFIYGSEGSGAKSKQRIRLIDNSFSFPGQVKHTYINASVFADNSSPGGYYDYDGYTIPAKELGLKEDEREALHRARAGVEDWISAKTIGTRRGRATLKRIDFLLKANKLSNFTDYFSDWRDGRL